MVPWGPYKALAYIKDTYGNPTVILSENGSICYKNLIFKNYLSYMMVEQLIQNLYFLTTIFK
ncbi:Beta-glucosidase 44 [Acorus gramineus]|uniref:Beta-glucosidase 44 n=1 Tax=Acorus gramineus TaxID=55184 RepID=A0AAV9BXD4_ACOGR|nr:Beta-glucosidase 44 [Acorus gramineus]